MQQSRDLPDGAPVAGDAPRMPTQRGDVPGSDVELLPRAALDDFRARWDRVQVAFVDQPRAAVQEAHDLVDDLVDRLTESFSAQRDTLEGTWSRGDDVSTEDLRLALQRYRTLFTRLLST